MSKYDVYEKREQKFVKWYIDLKPEHKLEELSNEENFSSNDFVMYSGRTCIMGEVKIRSFESTKYPTAVLELDKERRLMEKFIDYKIMDDNARLFYYAIYPEDRTILVFDILNTPTTKSYEYCPKSTAENKGSKYKSMVNYKVEDAIEIIKY